MADLTSGECCPITETFIRESVAHMDKDPAYRAEIARLDAELDRKLEELTPTFVRRRTDQLMSDTEWLKAREMLLDVKEENHG